MSNQERVRLLLQEQGRLRVGLSASRCAAAELVRGLRELARLLADERSACAAAWEALCGAETGEAARQR